ncbi:MAG: archaemetzincin-like protein [Candidatus Aramenus sulfurataquae]|jgi:predicted Zn-dependent protease|uniref:Archaemetzincin-like protein n=2 Tax=Candidatus Aramenus sulfurataquae TaxID=1326980 RepID=W7KJ25_9CREN|nr:MAG: archaemetzincin-like protein [Candidatus Aramenus sulfurataquae]MCL7343286.1 hypothetical protein [Candidatus Aramenus sulfurataquae]
MKKVLLVQVNKVDKSLLNAISSFLTENGFSVKTYPEIFHVSVTSYEWDKNGYNSSSLLDSFAKRFYGYPYDVVLGIADVPIVTPSLFATKDKLALLFIRNLEDVSMDKTIERLKKMSLFSIGKIAGLEGCKNQCIMRGFKDVHELDLLPNYYCEDCKARLNINDEG